MLTTLRHSIAEGRRQPTMHTPPSTGTDPAPASLLETMRLEKGRVVRLERHLARARRSAEVLGHRWEQRTVESAVRDTCVRHPAGVWRARLTIDVAGVATVVAIPYGGTTAVWRIAFANAPVDAHDWRLVHKTTAREPYEIARRSRPDVDDVVLWNEENEVTESTIANVVAEIDGVRWTPPVSSGLLAGVLRGELLDAGEIRERIITRGALARAEHVWLINSLRGWVEAMLVR